MHNKINKIQESKIKHISQFNQLLRKSPDFIRLSNFVICGAPCSHYSDRDQVGLAHSFSIDKGRDKLRKRKIETANTNKGKIKRQQGCFNFRYTHTRRSL